MTHRWEASPELLLCIPNHDIERGYGRVVAHASELQLLFGPFPPLEQELANQMADFYINFVNDLKPGGEFLSTMRTNWGCR